VRAQQTVSPWVRNWAGRIPSGSAVLDLACGSGRHSRYLAALGYRVLAVDRDAAALAALDGTAGVETLVADLENAAWPLDGRSFGGIVVTNYLHRPLFPRVLASLAGNGVLIYETFATGNERFGKPSNPDFLLRPGELLGVASGKLRVIAYEDLQVEDPAPAMVQRICAVRAGADP
jgi:SAM-dependent methyltransferase